MKKKLIVLSTLVAALAVAWVILPVADEAVARERCFPGGTTPVSWGHGSTCSAAVNDAINGALALVPGSCDLCDYDPIEVTPCEPCPTDPNDPDYNPSMCPPGDIRADYKVRYYCSENICIP